MLTDLITKRKSIFKECENILSGDREQMYGKPEDSSKVMSDYMSAYLGKKVSRRDTFMLLALMKLARESYKHKHDNIVDAINYLVLSEEVADEPSKS